MSVIPWYITVVRLLVPASILRWSLWGLLASSIVDMYDWKFVSVMTDQDMIVYQSWDKAMDLYYWLFILWIVWSWKDSWAKKIAVGLFSYRLVGMALYWLTQWRFLLFIFPNVFENFVIWCLVLFLLTKKEKLFLTHLQKITMLALLIIPKLIHEYFQHFLTRQPWELYNVGDWMGLGGIAQEYINYFAWGGLLYVVPLAGFLLLYGKNTTKQNEKRN